ncbi:MAG: ATP-binding domain-containing protein, partial [Clostridia bacterium]|nr:ATP-binding domain-containing protein [Clostridia bacterium]
ILNFDKHYDNTSVIKLEENYRSTKTILNAANAVIAKNSGRLGKTLWTEGNEGDKIVIKNLGNQNDEGRYIAEMVLNGVKDGAKFKDFAVLYRMNSQSRNIEQAFTKSSIPYRMLGGMRFFDRMEVKDIIAYLALINNPNDDLRLRRIINTPRRGIGDKSIQIAEALAYEEGCPLLEFLRRAKRYSAISQATANQMVSFVYLIDSFRDAAAQMPPSELIELVVEQSGYNKMLHDMTDLAERDDRLNNIGELVSAARQYEENAEEPSLIGFLEDVALVSDVDKYDETADAVVLMTIHSAKGLEFPTVFLPGMEENIFPSFQTTFKDEEIEEERRLAYVAITRAKKSLYITHVRDRMMNGRSGSNALSRFACEIPPELTEREDETPQDAELRQLRQRPVKQKPVNHFVKETSKPSPALTALKTPAAAAASSAFDTGDRVKHVTFGEGTILSSKKMGSDTLYEIAFDKVGTKKLMATYARLTKV